MVIVAYGAIFGLLLGWLLGGRLSALRSVHLRWAWLVLPVVPAQVLLIQDPWGSFQDLAVAGPLVLLSYIPIVLFVAANVRLPGLALVAVGLAANLAVMAANGGLMPVAPESIRAAGLMEGQEIVPGTRTTSSKGIILASSDTRLAPLSDVIVTPPPRQKVISIGDVLTFLGLAYAVQALMRRSPATASVVAANRAMLLQQAAHPFRR